MRRKWLPDNVTEYKDRHGKKRYRFRKKGLPVYHFRNAPGSPGFMEELHAAQSANQADMAAQAMANLHKRFAKAGRGNGKNVNGSNTKEKSGGGQG